MGPGPIKSQGALPYHGANFFVYSVWGSFIDDLAFMILAERPYFILSWRNQVTIPVNRHNSSPYRMHRPAIPPPVAICVFVVKNITKVPAGVIYSGVYPFLISLFLVVILERIFPQIVTFLQTC